MGYGGKVILNGIELAGVRAIDFNVDANSMMEARILIRVNETHFDGVTMDVLLEAIDAEV